jgi:quercetin dioxygenase-like cupin family protein
MAGLIRMSLDSPEEIRPFEGGTGQLQLVNMKEGGVGRATFQPGWRWSEHVKPIAKTASCQAAHRGYFISGRMKVVMDDGEEMVYGPGDFAIMAPGHDAWVIGDEPCVLIAWQGLPTTPSSDDKAGWVAGGGLADPGRPAGDDDAGLGGRNTIADRLATPG